MLHEYNVQQKPKPMTRDTFKRLLQYIIDEEDVDWIITEDDSKFEICRYIVNDSNVDDEKLSRYVVFDAEMNIVEYGVGDDRWCHTYTDNDKEACRWVFDKLDKYRNL